MPPELTSGLMALAGALLGGLISIWIQRQRNAHEFRMHQEAHKTEFMAEETARHYLMSERWTDRSFEMLRERLGGFEDDEIRRILVRAGAVRFVRENQSEWWRLLERTPEAAERLRAKREAAKNEIQAD